MRSVRGDRLQHHITVLAIQDAVTRSPTASTRSRELYVSQSTVWRILRYTPYHIQIMHKLEPEDFAALQAMCFDLLDAVENENLMNNVLFSDEGPFMFSA
ncbi:hypothetical protein ANN_19459 [Periplaneta americana]|uniref:Uncharacterized protein n=1 Tax=Periplaneta americana TaxID=6978 RepID=A0ABQ8SAB9_PERAM|nr:hypothetical protein ANN_19459 [Periplaneta americana]